LDLERLREWIGRTEQAADRITAAPVAALSATLDRDDPLPREGDALPPLWHWLYFLPKHRQSELAEDGHPKLGGFLPPVPLPSRMWAGSRLEFPGALRIGDEAARTSRIVDVKLKEGRTGPLIFVVARHEVANSEGVAIVEEHDIVYREHPKPGQPKPEPQQAPAAHAWARTIRPDDVLLFRYSAVTFNGHRIHYDRRYCTEVEHYPGLVVHGPLIATLLTDLLRRSLPEAHLTKFAFRAVSPLFDNAPFQVCGEPAAGGQTVRLWAQNAQGGLAMDATATVVHGSSRMG
jgi:3-methylfumaryl-CoA hydratase